MSRFEFAARTVTEALRTRRIGIPVAVRVLANLTADHGVIERQLARILEGCADWFESQPDRLNAFGGAQAGQVSVLARFETGATALVSTGASATERPILEVTVWGNRGVLSWDGAGVEHLALDGEEDPRLSKSAERFLQWIGDALASGHSVHIQNGTGTVRGNGSRPVPARLPTLTARVAKGAVPPFGVLLIAGDHTHQPNYAEAFLDDPRCRLIGLTDEANLSPRRQERNEQLARRLGIPVLPDLDAALGRPDVQIVSVCAEPERRGPLIVRAARAGKHVYLDKPLAGSLAEADAVVAAVRDARVIDQMWSLVHTGHAARIRSAVQAGTLGDLIAVHQDLCFAKGHAGTADLGQPRREDPSPRHFELPEAKRELTNVGVYPLVMLLWLNGRHVRRVCANTGNFFFREHQNHDMEDFGQLLLELDDGLVATISAGRTGWRSHPSNGLNRVYLLGNRAHDVFDVDRPRIEVWADVEPWMAPERNPEDPMAMWATPQPDRFKARPKQSWITPPALGANDDIKRFLDSVEAGRASDVPAALGAEATEVLLAAYRSAANGEVVPLPLPREAG